MQGMDDFLGHTCLDFEMQFFVALALSINAQRMSLFSFWTLSMCKRERKP